MSLDKMSRTKCPWTKSPRKNVPGQKRPRIKCPRTKCPRTKCPRIKYVPKQKIMNNVNNVYRNRDLETLKRYSKAKRTRAPAYSRALRRIKGGFPKGVKRSSGPNSRVPGGDRVAVRVGVV